MPLETLSLSEISSSILDPFSDEFLTRVAEVNEQIATIAENERNQRSPKKRRAVTPKFYLSKDLIKRLDKLKKATQDPDVLAVVEALLTKTRQENSAINYLGLSRDDFSKISYMDIARVERFKNETFTNSYLKSGTKITVNRTLRRWQYQTGSHFEESKSYSLKLTSSRVPKPIPCTLSEDGHYIVPDDVNLNIHSRTLIGEIRTQRLTDGRNTLIFSNSLYNTIRLDYTIEPVTVTQSMLWNPDRRYHSSVGKVVRKVFGNLFSDNAICKFAEEYFKLIVVQDTNYDLIFAEGSDIRKYYHQDSYLPQNSSQLWNSCMRYPNCQSYFAMYEQNPNCRLAVLLYKQKGATEPKVAARTLVWKNAKGNFIDRIYYHNNRAESIMKNQLISLGYKDMRSRRAGYHEGEIVEIEASIMDDLIASGVSFPYVDSLKYYDYDRKVLTPECPSYNYASFSQTGGSFENRTPENTQTFCCDRCGEDVNEEDLYYIELGRSRGNALCTDCATWIDGRDVYVHEDDAVCDIYDEYIYIDDAIELCDGRFVHENDSDLAQYENNYGYFVTGDSAYNYIEIGDMYYHPEDPESIRLQAEAEAEAEMERYNKMEEEAELANYEELKEESSNIEQITQINETNNETNQPTIASLNNDYNLLDIL